MSTVVDIARKRAAKAIKVRDQDSAAKQLQPLRRMQTARILAMNNVSPSVREGILGPDVLRAFEDLNLEKMPVVYEKLDRHKQITVMAARSQAFLQTWG
jgi:hypothetical protein